MILKKKMKNTILGLLVKIIFFLFFSLSVWSETIEKKYAYLKLLNKTTNKVSEKNILVNSKIKESIKLEASELNLLKEKIIKLPI